MITLKKVNVNVNKKVTNYTWYNGKENIKSRSLIFIVVPKNMNS